MTKKKKTIISIVSIFCALIIGLGCFFGIRAYRNLPHFTVKDTLPDGQGKKATVILLGGQSNAAGCSRSDYLQKNVSPEQYQEYQNGYENVYINYYVSGASESHEFVKCAVNQGEPGGYFGPELGMAEKLNELYPDQLFFIVKYTWSGTDLFQQWLSPSSDGKTGDLYEAFVAFAKASVKYLRSKNYDVSLEGMCWMQGESDSFSVEHATGYETHLSNFINDIRNKFSRHASNDGIAFIDAYIADNPVYWVYCDMVNESKRKVAELSPLNVVIDTSSLTTNQEPEGSPDQAHYDSLSEIKLGHLFIESLSQFF